MKRIVYSIYVDVPAAEHFGNSKYTSPNKNDSEEKATETINAFQGHYDRLLENKKDYAKKIGAAFKMYTYDDKYKSFEKNILKFFPELTGYEVINFYKIHILCELADVYDEILYLDFDVVPIQNINFFEHWDLTKGIAVLNNNDKIGTIESHSESSQTIRSPSSKFYNAQAMLFEKNMSTKNDVINTGIVGINKEHLDKLDYFKNFEDNLTMMTHLKIQIRDEVVYPNNEHGEVKIKKKNDKYVTNIFPDKIRQYFGWDNETLFSVKLKENNVPVQWLDDKWHYFLYNQGFIPAETILCHTINKNFELVWRRLNA